MAIPSQLISQLLRLTQQKKLTWNSVGTGSFRTSTGDTTVTVRESRSTFDVSVFDDDGNLLDRSEGFSSDLEGQLYDAARRLSLNVDKKISALESALKSLEND